MRRLRPILLLAWLAAFGAVAAPAGMALTALSSQQRLPNGQQLLVLCYHDVLAARAGGEDPESVDTETLAAHLNWLRSEGYRPIDLDTLTRAYAGTGRLPERAVLLTFDDGYLSLYTQVFPLLRAFRAPAVAALVGRWMQTPPGQSVLYSERTRPREQFISWEQAREMQDSGLVEFASHSWDLHRGLAGNPAGSLEPAATTHAYLPGRGYESDATWIERVRSDLERNSALFEQRLGRRPRAIVWPYGRYDDQTERIARELGMPIGLTLDSGRKELAGPIGRIRRLLVDGNPSATRLARLVRQLDDAPTVRFVQLGLDRLADCSDAEFESRLRQLLERIRALGVETVVLGAYAQPGASGRIDAVYFPNRTLPMRADLLNRVAWSIATLTQARVYAWLPSDGFALDPTAADPDARERVGDLFEDLGKAVYLQGLLSGSSTPGGAVEAVGDRAARLAERTRAWQPQLRTALRIDAQRDGLRPGQISALLELHDYLLVKARPGDDAGVQSEPLAAIRSVAGAAARTLIALPAPAGSAARVDLRAQRLQQAGFPNLGVVGADLDGSAEDLAALRRALSLRAQPAQATQGSGS